MTSTSTKTTRRSAGKRPTQGQIMQRIRASRDAAAKLTTIGQRVIVTRDDGTELVTTIKQLPWELGHGEWVVGCEGISGGYSTTRVWPARIKQEVTEATETKAKGGKL